jgi:hypothetical protein
MNKKFKFEHIENAGVRQCIIVSTTGVQTFHDKGPHKLLWAGLRAACKQ